MRLSVELMERARVGASRRAGQRRAELRLPAPRRVGDRSVELLAAAADVASTHRDEAEAAWGSAGSGGQRAASQAFLQLIAARRTEAALHKIAEGVRRQQASRCAPRGPRRARGPHHYHDLREAALKLARERVRLGGPEAVTMVGLARDLAVSAAALHAHFPRRADLLGAVAELVEQEMASGLSQVRTAESPDDGLRRASQVLLSIAGREPGTYRTLSREGAARRTIETGWLPNSAAFAVGQALAGGAPAQRAAEAAKPARKPAPRVVAPIGSEEWKRQRAALREWALMGVLAAGGGPLAMSPEVAQLGWLYTASLHGVAQALSVGMLDERRAGELAERLACLVAAAAESGSRSH